MKSEAIIEKIRSKLLESNPENRSVTSVFQFNIMDSGGNLIQSVVFDFKDLKIYVGTINTADGEITISDDDFYSIGTHQATFDELLTEKRVQLKGNQEEISKMMEKFRKNFKK